MSRGTLRTLVLIRWAGFAAAVGGALWVVKGTAIILTGDQPEYIFELAPAFFAVGLVGLYALLQGRGGTPGRAGGLLALAGLGLAVPNTAYYVATTDDEGVVLNVTIALASLAIFAGLVLLGIAVRRADALPGRWRSLPLAIGAGAVPLTIVVGGVLEAVSERLFEVPIVVLGLAWIALGYAIWGHARNAPGETSLTRA